MCPIKHGFCRLEDSEIVLPESEAESFWKWWDEQEGYEESALVKSPKNRPAVSELIPAMLLFRTAAPRGPQPDQEYIWYGSGRRNHGTGPSICKAIRVYILGELDQ